MIMPQLLLLALLAGSPEAVEAPMPAHAVEASVLLNDGRVLAIFEPRKAVASALFDPLTGRWRSLAGPRTPRWQFGSALLRDGRLLLAGGLTMEGYTATCELFDP